MSVAHAILCACFFVIHISSAPDVNVFHRNAVFKAKINKLNAFWARCRSYDSLNAAKLTTANLHHYFKADVAIVPGSVNFSSNIIHLTFSAHSRYTSRLYFHPTDGLHFVWSNSEHCNYLLVANAILRLCCALSRQYVFSGVRRQIAEQLAVNSIANIITVSTSIMRPRCHLAHIRRCIKTRQPPASGLNMAAWSVRAGSRRRSTGKTRRCRNWLIGLSAFAPAKPQVVDRGEDVRRRGGSERSAYGACRDRSDEKSSDREGGRRVHPPVADSSAVERAASWKTSN